MGIGHVAPHCHGNRLMGLGSAGAERDVSLIQLSQLGRGGWVSLQQAPTTLCGEREIEGGDNEKERRRERGEKRERRKEGEGSGIRFVWK